MTARRELFLLAAFFFLLFRTVAFIFSSFVNVSVDFILFYFVSLEPWSARQPGGIRAHGESSRLKARPFSCSFSEPAVGRFLVHSRIYRDSFAGSHVQLLGCHGLDKHFAHDCPGKSSISVQHRTCTHQMHRYVSEGRKLAGLLDAASHRKGAYRQLDCSLEMG